MITASLEIKQFTFVRKRCMVTQVAPSAIEPPPKERRNLLKA